jgi:hypothetical protein
MLHKKTYNTIIACQIVVASMPLAKVSPAPGRQ